MSKGVGMPDERIFFQYSAYPFNAAPLIKNEILPDVWVYNDFFIPMIWEEEKSDIFAKFPAFNGRLLTLISALPINSAFPALLLNLKWEFLFI